MPVREMPETPLATQEALEALEKKVKELEEKLTSLEQNTVKVATSSPPWEIKFGFVAASTDGGGNIAVTYATPFATGTSAVLFTGNESTDIAYRTSGVSRFGFTAFWNHASVSDNFYWIAIGR